MGDYSYNGGRLSAFPGQFMGHVLGVACAASAQITIPDIGARQVIIQADGADVRFRLDDTNPTASVGHLLKNGSSITLSAADAAAAKFIQVTATAVLNAWLTL